MRQAALKVFVRRVPTFLITASMNLADHSAMRVARAPVRRGRLEHGYHSAYRVYCSLYRSSLYVGYAYGKNGAVAPG